MRPSGCKFRTIFGMFFLILSLATVSGAEQNLPDTKLAMLAALDFLESCDRENYAAGWAQTAQLFRENTDQDKWQLDIQHLRRQYGKNLQRTLQHAEPIETETAVNQEMLFLIFQSRFAKKSAAEMLTMTKENSKHWRVAGYSIQ